MNDREFFELHLRATIVPQQVRWAAPELPHWQRLHEAANEARERVRKAYLLMDEIDRRAELSRDDKYRQRGKIAAQAIADFEESKTLARAREAVKLVVAKHNVEEHVTDGGDVMLKALNEVEQGWPKAMDKIAEHASLRKGPHNRRQ